MTHRSQDCPRIEPPGVLAITGVLRPTVLAQNNPPGVAPRHYGRAIHPAWGAVVNVACAVVPTRVPHRASVQA